MIFSKESFSAIIGLAMLGIAPSMAAASEFSRVESYSTIPRTLTGGSFGTAIRLESAASLHFNQMSGDLDTLSRSANLAGGKITYFGRDLGPTSGRLHTRRNDGFLKVRKRRSAVKIFRPATNLSQAGDRLLVPKVREKEEEVINYGHDSSSSETRSFFDGLYRMATVASDVLQSLVKGLTGS